MLSFFLPQRRCKVVYFLLGSKFHYRMLQHNLISFSRIFHNSSCFKVKKGISPTISAGINLQSRGRCNSRINFEAKKSGPNQILTKLNFPPILICYILFSEIFCCIISRWQKNLGATNTMRQIVHWRLSRLVWDSTQPSVGWTCPMFSEYAHINFLSGKIWGAANTTRRRKHIGTNTALEAEQDGLRLTSATEGWTCPMFSEYAL